MLPSYSSALPLMLMVFFGPRLALVLLILFERVIMPHVLGATWKIGFSSLRLIRLFRHIRQANQFGDLQEQLIPTLLPPPPARHLLDGVMPS